MKWISVKDRLPSDDSDVVVWVEDGDIGYPSLAWMHEYGMFVNDDMMDWGLPVTHWIPLPPSIER